MPDDIPIGFALIDAARLLRARFDHALAGTDLDLTPGEARALVYASHYPGTRTTALAAYMGVEPMTLIGFLDRLEAHGLIVREPDPTDRRARTVHLTPQAGPLLARVVALFTSTRAALLSDFTAEEQDVFKAMLLRLRARLLDEARQGKAP
ncbi:MarR family winged helix-turn-helix transcriptional regulator [Azospirillum sp.]|uniref:MarR family winged helix-turn-helix transcriptional regulator n=1 Tax=Azospirillum sp. TaxID=34012 RepID=UPI003D75E1D1